MLLMGRLRWPFLPISIRQIIRLNSNVVRLRVLNKAHRLDLAKPLQESLADAVHPIHHASVTRKNNGECKIAIEHQASVVDDLAAGQLLARRARPIRFVEFPDGRQGNALTIK
jgi:hypothetical protein